MGIVTPNCEIVRIDKIFQIVKIYEMAVEIWNEHYKQILSKEQIDYMLDKYQSPKAITSQIVEGYDYYILSTEGQDFGYFCIKKEDERLFISKLYFLQNFRGNGFASRSIEYLKDFCKQNNLSKILLNVNKNNKTSISIYEKLGFVITESVEIDIEDGFVLDDYVMTLTL